MGYHAGITTYVQSPSIPNRDSVLEVLRTPAKNQRSEDHTHNQAGPGIVLRESVEFLLASQILLTGSSDGDVLSGFVQSDQ